MKRGAVEEYDPSVAAATLGAWDVAIRATHRDGFKLERDFLLTPGLMMYTDAYATPAHILAAARADVFTIALPLNVIAETRCFGQRISNSSGFISFGGCVEFSAAAGQHLLIILIELELLEQLAGPEQIHHCREMAGKQLVMISADEMALAARKLLRLLAHTKSDAKMFTASQTLIALEAEIVTTIVDLLLLPVPSRQLESSTQATRWRGFERALQLLEADGGREFLSIAGLCSAVGVSQRTLEYAFKQYAECTPKAFLKQRRYHQLRRLLLTDQDCTSVRHAAMQLGIFEFGRMAGEYRQLFGELPSQTFARREAQGMSLLAGLSRS